jgi:hypothetical protein
MSEVTPTPPAASKSKQWQDYLPAKKTRIAVQGMAQGIAQLVLVIWAVRDLRRRPDSEINGHKKLWMLAAFAPPIGPIAYFLFGRRRGRPTEGTHVVDERTGE